MQDEKEMPIIRKPRRPVLPPPNTPAKGARLSAAQVNYEALADFRFALRSFLAFSESAAKAAGLTPQQHQALLAIKGGAAGDTFSIRLLAERLLVHHNTAVELVDRLVESGLVKRSRAAEDRRRANLQLTSRAERLLQSLSAAHLQELQAIQPALLTLLRQLD